MMVFLFAVKLFRPFVKGRIGEWRVRLILKTLPKEKYKAINDIIINTKSGNTTQIDHVVVSCYGVFVIETKNYKGWMLGSENSQYWTQNIYGKKYKLYNPLLQNQAHARAIGNILEEQNKGEKHIIPIVVFMGGAKLKFEVTTNIVKWYKLRSLITSYTDEFYSEEQVRIMTETISKANISSKEVRQQHNRQVRQISTYKRFEPYEGKCPRCGGKLIKRSGPYGDFYGCSNYPRCKYTFNDD